MAEYDNLCKILAEKYPRDFIRWLLNQEPRTIGILKNELSIEPIRADSVTLIIAGRYYARISDLSGYFAEGRRKRGKKGRTKRSFSVFKASVKSAIHQYLREFKSYLLNN